MKSYQVKPINPSEDQDKMPASPTWKCILFIMKVGIIPMSFEKDKGFQFSMCSWKILSFVLIFMISFGIMDFPFYVMQTDAHIDNVTRRFLDMNVTDLLSWSALSAMYLVGALMPIQFSHCCSNLKFSFDSVNFKTVPFPRFGKSYIICVFLDAFGLILQETANRQQKLDDLNFSIDQIILVYCCHSLGFFLRCLIGTAPIAVLLVLFEMLEEYFSKHDDFPQKCLEYYCNFKTVFGPLLLLSYGLMQLVSIGNVFLAITPFLAQNLEFSWILILTTIGYVLSEISTILFITGKTLTVEKTYKAFKLVPKKFRNTIKGEY